MTKVLKLFMFMDAQSSSLSEREFTVFQCVWREMKRRLRARVLREATSLRLYFLSGYTLATCGKCQ